MLLETARTLEERLLASEGVLRTETEILRIMRADREDLQRQNTNMERALEMIRAREAAREAAKNNSQKK